MPSIHISKDLNNGVYFLTFTVKKWYHIFDRHNRWNIVADSLRFCREHKNLKIYGFVFMTNHIHIIVESPNVADFIRDFKRHTSREIHKNIVALEQGIERLFVNPDGKFAVWQETNMPIFLESEKVFLQKLNYIQENPVRKNYVINAEDWYWTSANEKCKLRTDDVNE